MRTGEFFDKYTLSEWKPATKKVTKVYSKTQILRFQHRVIGRSLKRSVMKHGTL